MTNLSQLAAYACTQSSGRLFTEIEDIRNPFERDRDRIIHSSAFRRLQYKTQVFVNYEGDHYRTRLTHSLEVAQVARSIARRLNINEDLTELTALAHDIGHPPFGHAGEDGLKEVAKEYGGYDHNSQALKILCFLERKYESFPGLNLNKESIESILKHNGPIDLSNSGSNNQIDGKQLCPNAIKTIQKISDSYEIDLSTQACLEGQVAALADDIAYCNHDIDDGIRASMINLDELKDIYLLDTILAKVADVQNPNIRVAEFIRKTMSYMIIDLIETSQTRLKDHKIKSLDDVKAHSESLIGFSPEVEKMKTELKAFLYARVYRNYRINRMSMNARKTVSFLFEEFMKNPECLPTEWRKQLTNQTSDNAVIVLDYISGMTDRYALKEYSNLSKFNHSLTNNHAD